MKILITNTVALNGGDAAILLSIIDLFRTEFGQNTEFIIYDSQPEIASLYYPGLNFRKLLYLKSKELPPMNSLGKTLLGRIFRFFLKKLLRISADIHLYMLYYAAWFWQQNLRWIARILVSKDDIKDIEHYSSAQLVVSTGGTYLVENYSLEQRIFDYHFTILMQRPLVFYTQSLGPFHKPENQIRLRPIFNSSLITLVRDELSRKHLQDLDVDATKIHVSSDVVFALDNNFSTNISEEEEINNSPLKVIISVRHWHHFKHISSEEGLQNYKSAIVALTQFLIDNYQAQVTYLSTCQGIPEYWQDDSKFAQEIVELLPNHIQSSVQVNPEFHTPQELLELLNKCNVVIATRMHMCILSLIAGTPVLPIAYEFKTKELFKRLNCEKWVQDIENINEELLVETAKEFVSALPEIRKNLFVEVKKERNNAMASVKLVRRELDNL